MRTVMAFGTFDGIHPGHQDMLRQAKAHGDRLVVVLARDETVREVKGKSPRFDETERLVALRSLPMVDEALLGYAGDKLKVVYEFKPDVICLGYDQKAFTEKLQEKLSERGLHPEIVRLKPHKPEKYKSSLLNGH